MRPRPSLPLALPAGLLAPGVSAGRLAFIPDRIHFFDNKTDQAIA